MMDFNVTEMHVRAIISQRDRDAAVTYRLAEFRQPPRGLRAALATRFAHLAVHLDRESTDRLIGRHYTTAHRQG